MMQLSDFSDIEPKAASTVPTAAQVATGVPIPPVKLLEVMSPDDWEGFTEECLTFRKQQGHYQLVRRYTGPGDLGLDVVAFTSLKGFEDPWDSYQCKHYNHALFPTDIYGEVAKIIYHSFHKTPPFNQAQRVPRKHVFVCPFGVGITVGRLLADPNRFKSEVREKWLSQCVSAIGAGVSAPLEDDFLEYFEQFDFSIFEDVSPVELIEEHSQTPFYAPRFGGGFPPRVDASPPPTTPTADESVYLKKLIDAYGDHLGTPLSSSEELDSHVELRGHYNRQRILFYSAESLRNFARDRTPHKTFEALQNDVYDGVIDTCDSNHADGLVRLRKTITIAGGLDVSGNALVSVTRVRDKQGICHQLANDDRLTWKKPT